MDTTTLLDNGSDVTTVERVIDGPEIYSLEHLVGTSVILGLVILCTITGNVFVIAAIILEKNLHNVANYLILSLAVADLMVASIVMPISAVNEVSSVWFFRSEICDMWVSLDVLCCTSSILHIMAISIDRYWAVTSIDYMRNRTAKHILVMIASVWFAAMLIAVPPLFGWRDNNDHTKTGVCKISQNHGYTIFSTVGAFYLPTILMFIIYAKIFAVAKQRIRKKRFAQAKKKASRKIASNQTEMKQLTVSKDSHISRSEISEAPGSGCSGNSDHDDNENKCKTNGHEENDEKSAMLQKTNSYILKSKRQKKKLETKRERKATRTLAIITGVYSVCWLPFFITTIVTPFVRELVDIPDLVLSVTLWLGYCNSLLNPIIYTAFNPEFRAALKILFGKYFRKQSRNSHAFP